MPAQFTIRPGAAAGFPWVTLEGLVTHEVILQAIDALCVEGGYTTASRLWDFRGCTIDLSNEELRSIVEYGRVRDREPGRAAILADTDVIYGLGRMYEVFRSSETSAYRAFRDEVRALAWLGGGRNRPTPDRPRNPTLP